MRFLGLIVLGACVISGCAPKAARTIPSGQALKEKLAKEGNPTSWVFHVPIEKVQAAIHDRFPGSRQDDSGAVLMELKDDTRDCCRGYRMVNTHDVPLGYEASLALRIAEVQGGTRVSVETMRIRATFCINRRMELYWYCCPCADCSMGGCHAPWESRPRPMDVEVPANTVGEYEVLSRLGKVLGELGMPELRVPEIEIVP